MTVKTCLPRQRRSDLRISWVVDDFAAGANPFEVAEQLGYIDAQLGFKWYGHLYSGASRRALLRLDSITGTALGVGRVWDSASPGGESFDDFL